MIRTWFILVSSKACKCDSVGFILFKFYSGLPCYKKVKDDARDEKKTGEGRGKDNAPPPLFFVPCFLFVYHFFNAFHPSKGMHVVPKPCSFALSRKMYSFKSIADIKPSVYSNQTLTCLAARASICNFFLLFRISCSNN